MTKDVWGGVARARELLRDSDWSIAVLGKHKAVLARYARNRRLADACYLWAFAAITVISGARACYDQKRAAGDTTTGHYAHSPTA